MNHFHKSVNYLLRFCTGRAEILHDNAVRDFDLINLACSDAVVQCVEISAVPRRSADRAKERIVEIISRLPTGCVQQQLPHFNKSRAMIMRWTSLVPS